MEQNVLVTKMIGIVVAVIVAAVVLVPICNSLTEGDGGSGSGGGGSYAGLVTDLRYADMDEVRSDFYIYHISFCGSAYDHETDTGLSGVFIEYSLTLSPNSSDAPEEGVLLSYVVPSPIPFSQIEEYNEQYSFSMPISIGVDREGKTYTEILIGGYAYDYEDEARWELYRSTYYVGVDDSWNPSTEDITTEFAASGATSDDDNNYPTNTYMLYPGGDYVYVDNPVYSEGDKVIHVDGLWEVGSADDKPIWTRGISAYIGQIGDMQTGIGCSLKIWDYENDYENELNVALQSVTVGTSAVSNGTRLDGIVADAQFDDMEVVQYDFRGRAIVLYDGEGGGSGGSSDSGSDLGVAGTIIGIIPVFVILAILMGAAGLFYQNRNGL